MSAPHFFTTSLVSDRIEIGGEDARHATGALRITVGEEISVSDGAGTVARARVTETGAHLRADVFERTVVPRPRPRVIVCPAIAKADKNELVVQKLVELGVDEIRPWFAERTIVRWDANKTTRNITRWRAVAYEAAKQSHRIFLPQITEPTPPLLAGHLAVVLHEEAAVLLRDVQLDLDAPGDVVLVIGPEGGLSPAEVARFAADGGAVTSLGSQILRTETASVVGSALILSRVGRLG